MTTDNPTNSLDKNYTQTSTAPAGRQVRTRSLDKTSTAFKTLSLRPARSVKKNNSFKMQFPKKSKVLL